MDISSTYQVEFENELGESCTRRQAADGKKSELGKFDKRARWQGSVGKRNHSWRWQVSVYCICSLESLLYYPLWKITSSRISNVGSTLYCCFIQHDINLRVFLSQLLP